MDNLMVIETLNSTYNPNQCVYLAAHQDYSSKYIGERKVDYPLGEKRYGEMVIDMLLKGDRGHYGPLEHPQIVLSCGYIPHSVMQQLRTHRNLSFDVQSFRYTGSHILVTKSDDLEDVIYLRPEGYYSDRSGNKYHYDHSWRNEDLVTAYQAIEKYKSDLLRGKSEEHARGLLPFDYRQHFVMSGNLRSILHLLDLRSKKDAQLEIQWFCDLLMDKVIEWTPEIGNWYKVNRYGKARLSP